MKLVSPSVTIGQNVSLLACDFSFTPRSFLQNSIENGEVLPLVEIELGAPARTGNNCDSW
jgi:hypothetical protein